jgi:hypothetical protein
MASGVNVIIGRGVNFYLTLLNALRSLTYDSFEAKLCLAQKLYGKRHNTETRQLGLLVRGPRDHSQLDI